MGIISKCSQKFIPGVFSGKRSDIWEKSFSWNPFMCGYVCVSDALCGDIILVRNCNLSSSENNFVDAKLWGFK